MRYLILFLCLIGCSQRVNQSALVPQSRGVSLHLFAASWCAECVNELRALKAWQQRNPPLNLVVYLLEDSEQSTKRLQEEIDLPFLFDPGDALRQTFKVRSIPKGLLFDCSGKLRKIIDPHPKPGEELPQHLRSTVSFSDSSGIELIEALLKEPGCQ
jgi:thiol-disulfide isomerase/thioredoxin